MFCNNCGKAIDPNLAFCPECGAPIQNMNNNVGPQPMNQSMVQPMNQPMAQPMNQPMAQPMNQPMAQPMNQPMAQPMNQPMAQPMNQPMAQPMNQPMAQPMNQPMAQPMNQPMAQPIAQPMNNNGDKSNNKIIILIAVAVILLLLVLIIVVVGGGKDKPGKSVEAASRTILIYLCGSDLEERGGYASTDLAGINPSEIDLETTNVVVYAGGATKWHNFVNPNDTAIYVLTETGFVKKESYGKSNMGDSNSLLTLLDYGYKNYSADKYDLVIWNHGLGALGVSADTNFGGDHLTLNELSSALQKSNFDKDNKFETVIFRSCLNGTLEVATVFVPYANYLVASEEVTWGVRGTDLLGFINDVELDDDGKEVGTNYIAYYKNILDNHISKYGGSFDDTFGIQTYSIMDLSKVSNLQKNINLFVKDINLDLNYNVVAKARSNVTQYGGDATGYDTVDLHELVTELKSLSPGKAQNVLNAIEDAVVYNWTNTSFSKGVAVYFPYKGSEVYRTKHKNNYKNLEDLGEYYTFIYDFSSIQKKSYNSGFSAISKDNIDLKVNDKKAVLTLNDSNVDNFAKVSYMILEKVDNTKFNVVYESKTSELNKNVFEVDLDVKLVKVANSTIAIKEYDNDIYTTEVKVIDNNEKINGKLYFKVGSKVDELKIVPTNEEMHSGYILTPEDYNSIEYVVDGYNIYDDKGLELENWDATAIESTILSSGGTYRVSNVTNDYYIVFKIYDVDNLYTYSKVTKIN